MNEDIINIIKNAGVVGGGGAGLPTHIKADTTVDTVLVNGASCEPLLIILFMFLLSCGVFIPTGFVD